MSAPGTSELARTKWNLSWLASPQAWLERGFGALLLVAAVALCWHHGSMSLPKAVALWALLLVAVAVLLRRGWLVLFGPVLFYDLVRLGRRTRFFLLRCFYAFALLLVLYWTYERFMEDWVRLQRFMPGAAGYYLPDRGLRGADVARLAETFFYTFVAVQLAAVMLLTPAYTAGAIAEEKERKTLEFLLATDLQNREIVLSKLFARVANLTLLILTGLPILSLTQFLGGVDPNLVAAAFVATALTMVSLASFGILNSVHVKKPRDAIVLTYLGVAAYMALSSVLWAWPTAPAVARLFTAGNFFWILSELRTAVERGTDVATVIPSLLRNYALFHGLLALLFAMLAVLRLRHIALRQTQSRVQRTAGRWGRPRVGRLPMIWKELFMEPGLRLNWAGWAVVLAAIGLSMVPAIYIVGNNLLSLLQASPDAYVHSRVGNISKLAQEMNTWARFTTTTILCLMLVGVAVRAAGGISGERDRETLDGLLTSPLQSHDILFAKWLGSFLSVRWAWLWLFAVWGLGMLTEGVHPMVVPMQLSAWVVYAGTLAGLGLWFSTSCQTTTRATMWTLTVIGTLSALHWLMWLFCCPGGTATSFGIQSTITPPFILYWLCVGPTEAEGLDWDLSFILAMFGLIAWALAAAFLWSITRTRFRLLTSRMPYRRPDLRALPASEFARYLGQKY